MITIKQITIQFKTNLTSKIYMTAKGNHFVSFKSDFYIYLFFPVFT